MTTATVPMKVLVTVSLVAMLVLGLAIGYVISDATSDDRPMRMMSGMDMGYMGYMGDHMDDMYAHMGSMMGSGSMGEGWKDMPAMHGHD